MTNKSEIVGYTNNGWDVVENWNTGLEYWVWEVRYNDETVAMSESESDALELVKLINN